MENSFFEYRDKTGVDSDSDSEAIDDSMVANKSLSSKKKNHTVFVAESEESITDDESEDEPKQQHVAKAVVRLGNVGDALIISSDDDASRRASNRRSSDMSHNEVVLSSSDDEDEPELSPEMVPRRPPPRNKYVESKNPVIEHINKKRMIFDSDLDNSIVIEHNKNRKLACLKDTPIKSDIGKKVEQSDDDDGDDSDDDDGDEIDDDDGDETDDNDDDNEVISKLINKESKTNTSTVQSDEKSCDEDESDQLLVSSGKKIKNHKVIDSDESTDYDDHDEESESDNKDTPQIGKVNKIIDSDDDYDIAVKSSTKKTRKLILSDESESDDHHDNISEDDDGPDEDQMVMSRATRMSIMGVIPKDNGSDESDFIQSDDSHRKSANSLSTESLTELPEAIPKTPIKTKELDGDSSRISCSPIGSPLHDLTNEIDVSTKSSPITKIVDPIIDSIDLTQVGTNSLQNNLLNDKLLGNKENAARHYDDDVAIIDIKPEIIALSSDDEDEVKDEKKSPNMKRSPKPKSEKVSPKGRKDNSIKSYLVPPSYPNQGVVYVQKHVRENELSKLNSLKEDLHNIRHLLENMDVDTLPDGGVKLIERLTALDAEVRRQGEKVANMVVEPENPTAQDVANDGFSGKVEKGLTWDDIQKASNAVQPRMFGKQAMATHMAERNLILDRLRDLHESLASCPPESELAAAPRCVSTELMPHQRHALAWLRWRETQRPAAGILADDMGLGKTITMIALIASDKEARIDDESDDEYARGGSKLSGGGTLVVCPASLVQQWAGEVARHCSAHALSLALHHGPARASHPHRLATHDLVITTYNILQRDNEKNGVLMRVRWRRVILDEAHVVRNHKSATSVAVSALAARRRWCLTGTPVQNKDLDLFALLKFLRCSPFDELQMWKKWIDNKSLGGQERLSTLMRCILLRRTKQQLQQRGQLNCLPERTAHQTLVTLTKPEMNVYQKVLVFSKTLFAQFLHQRAEKNADAQGFANSNKDTEYAKMHKKMIALQGAKPVKSHEILVLLLRLRQVCCHCGLIAAMLDEECAADVQDDGAGDLLAELNKMTLEDAGDKRRSSKKEEKEEEKEEPKEEGTTAAEAIRSVLSPNNPVFELDRPSSKIKAVMDCLKENVFPNKGDKAVVVSQWTSVLRLVEREAARLRVRCVTLSGAVPVPARPALIERLNDPKSDVKVMLLSLCAGGVGLNLCGANHLLLLDPHWNPQLEEQAQDRIYRVGQAKHVHIYRFMCVDTVEQTIRKLQEVKLELAANVLTGARNTNASKLSIEDLKMLFNMGPQ